jgi:hypothetical protein
MGVDVGGRTGPYPYCSICSSAEIDLYGSDTS